MSKPRIAVDFDGVIHKYSKGWFDGSIYDEPVDGARQSLEILSQRYDVIIFTTRLNPNLSGEKLPEHEANLKEWLTKYGFLEGVHYTELTALKPKAKLYLDDRALKFDSWDKALGDIESLA